MNFAIRFVAISMACIKITFHEFSDGDVVDLLLISDGDELQSIAHLKSAWSCCSTFTTYSWIIENVWLLWLNYQHMVKKSFQISIHRITVTIALTVCESTVSAEGIVTIHLAPSSNNLPVSIFESLSFDYLYNISYTKVVA